MSVIRQKYSWCFSFSGSNQGSLADWSSMDSLKNENKGPENYEYQEI